MKEIGFDRTEVTKPIVDPKTVVTSGQVTEYGDDLPRPFARRYEMEKTAVDVNLAPTAVALTGLAAGYLPAEGCVHPDCKRRSNYFDIAKSWAKGTSDSIIGKLRKSPDGNWRCRAHDAEFRAGQGQ